MDQAMTERAITESDATERFSEMLREVRNGATFVVTSEGRPVAKVVPVDDMVEVDALAEQEQRIDALNEYMASRPRLTLLGWRREDLYD